MRALLLPFREQRAQPFIKTVSAARFKCRTQTFGFSQFHSSPQASNPQYHTYITWHNTLYMLLVLATPSLQPEQRKGTARKRQSQLKCSLQAGLLLQGKRQFIPVKLISSAHTSLMESNWLQKARLACPVGCSASLQQSDVERSAGKNKHGQGGSFCPKKHSSDELHWQSSKDAVLWKMSRFSRFKLFGPEWNLVFEK